MIRNVLVDPNRFFEEFSEDPELLRPALVVLVAAIANVASGFYIANKMWQAQDGNLALVLAVGGVVGTVTGLVGVFVVWLVYSAVFYLLSSYFDGTGRFRDTVKFVGWGFVPTIFAGLLSSLVTIYALHGVTFPDDPQQMSSFVRQVQNSPLFVASGVSRIVFILWQGFLWAFAVKYARDIELRESAMVVAVPVLLSILWTVYNML